MMKCRRHSRLAERGRGFRIFSNFRRTDPLRCSASELSAYSFKSFECGP